MQEPVIVIDNGAHSIKSGFAGDFAPQYIFESKVARVKLHQNNYQVFCADEIRRAPKSAEAIEVFQDPSSIDWNGVEKLYKHLIHSKMQLQTYDDRHYYVLSEMPCPHLHQSVQTQNRTEAAQVMFESMNAKGVYYGYTPSLSLYAAGLTSGLVIESGYRNTIVAPIDEGYLLPLQTRNLSYGGLHVTEYLQSLLLDASISGESPSCPINVSVCRDIKERCCFVQTNAKEYQSTSDGVTYELPDGALLRVGSETRYKVGELMFGGGYGEFEDTHDSGERHQTPSESKRKESLPYVVHQTVGKCHTSLHKTMYGNIVISGGNSMLAGISDRLLNSLVHLAPAYVKVNIHASPQRDYAAFTGASILGAQSEMKNVWIDDQLYDELGAQAFAVRCF